MNKNVKEETPLTPKNLIGILNNNRELPLVVCIDGNKFIELSINDVATIGLGHTPHTTNKNFLCLNATMIGVNHEQEEVAEGLIDISEDIEDCVDFLEAVARGISELNPDLTSVDLDSLTAYNGYKTKAIRNIALAIENIKLMMIAIEDGEEDCDDCCSQGANGMCEGGKGFDINHFAKK